MLPVVNVAKNTTREMFCIHINTANVFLQHQATKKKKKSNSECCKKYPFVIFYYSQHHTECCA
jgi:hypothetical protein